MPKIKLKQIVNLINKFKNFKRIFLKDTLLNKINKIGFLNLDKNNDFIKITKIFSVTNMCKKNYFKM